MSDKVRNIPKLRFPEFRDAPEWEEKVIGDIGRVSMCKRVMKDETSETGDIPFYKIGTFGKKADAYISKALYEDYITKYPYPKKGDILISASGTIGRLVVFDGLPAYFQDSNIVWIDNDEKIVKNSFLLFFYTTVKWSTEDTTIARLYNDNLRNVRILVPSIEEQQKIADCLSSIDELITSQAAKVEALKEHKKALMQQLFPREGETVPRLRFPEFQNAPEWEEKLLSDISEIIMGQSPDSNTYNTIENGKPLIQGNADIFNRKTNPRIWTSEPTKECKEGDIILTVRAPVGAVAKSFHDACIGRGVCAIKPKESVEFLYQFLLTQEDRWDTFSQGSTFTAINGNDIKNFKLNTPKLDEQQKIGSCLSSIDELITSQAAKAEALKEHKKALMQQLFPTDKER